MTVTDVDQRGRSQKFARGEGKTKTGGRKSPSGVQGQSSGGGLGAGRSSQKLETYTE